jgi:hypothetical protein
MMYRVPDSRKRSFATRKIVRPTKLVASPCPHQDSTSAMQEDVPQEIAATPFIGARFVARFGRAYAPAPFKGKRGPMGFCYMNAFRYCKLKSSQARGLVYVEGYATSRTLWLPHAWVADPKTSKVIDPTWSNTERYFGVPFSLRTVERIVSDQNHYGLLHTNITPDSAISRLDARMRFLWEELMRLHYFLADGRSTVPTIAEIERQIAEEGAASL